MFEIETGIEMPPILKRGKYPLKEMEIGDSFFIPASQSGNNVSARITPQAQRIGIKIITRKVEGGYRVWRYE